MKSLKYLKRRLKKNKTNKTKKNRNKSRKNRRGRGRGGMKFDRMDSTNTDAYGDNINASTQKHTEKTPASFFSHQPGVGRSGLGLRNAFRNSYLGLRGVDTSDCNKKSFDTSTSAQQQVKIYSKCCHAKSSSPFCKYARNVMSRNPKSFDDSTDDEDTIDKSIF